MMSYLNSQYFSEKMIDRQQQCTYSVCHLKCYFKDAIVDTLIENINLI